VELRRGSFHALWLFSAKVWRAPRAVFAPVTRLGALLLGVALAPLATAFAEAPARASRVVDLHVDLAFQHVHRGKPFEQGTGQFALAELSADRVSGVVLPLYVPLGPSGRRPEDFERAYAGVLGHLLSHPLLMAPGCLTQPRRIRTWLAFEGADSLRPEAVAYWALRGVRVFGLVHNQNNPLMSSAAQSHDYGVTPLGRAVIEEVHRVGGLIDVSHASDRALEDVLGQARQLGAVVVATHSNARTLASHPRNLTDQQLREIAATGGVIGINFHQPFLARGRKATISDVVRHILHVRKVAGIAHVALGSDFEGDIQPAAGLKSALHYGVLAKALAEAGLGQPEVDGVMGDNALRVLCQRGFTDLGAAAR
jgi:membrane dipeptidase